MLRFAISVVGSLVWTTLSLAGPIGISNTHPQGQERSPTEREFFAPVPAPANFAEVAGPTVFGKRIDFDNAMLHFQRSLGMAQGMLVARRGT